MQPACLLGLADLHMQVCRFRTAAAWGLVAFSVVVFAALEYHHH
jgi:uncharacterized membrane protein